MYHHGAGIPAWAAQPQNPSDHITVPWLGLLGKTHVNFVDELSTPKEGEALSFSAGGSSTSLAQVSLLLGVTRADLCSLEGASGSTSLSAGSTCSLSLLGPRALALLPPALPRAFHLSWRFSPGWELPLEPLRVCPASVQQVVPDALCVQCQGGRGAHSVLCLCSALIPLLLPCPTACLQVLQRMHVHLYEYVQGHR